jgi:hypothetical protein
MMTTPLTLALGGFLFLAGLAVGMAIGSILRSVSDPLTRKDADA